MKFNFLKLKKKDKKVEDTQENNQEKDIVNVAKAEYTITIKEEIGDTLREVKTFQASRWVDKEDFLVYLYNPKLNFMELFPQREKDLIKLDPKEIKEKLNNKRKELKKLGDSKGQVDDNKKNVELEVMQLEAKLKASEWKKTAFLEFGSRGEKKMTFVREGTNMFPIAYDAERNIYGIPSDIRKKSASILMRNKENKYNKHKKLIEGTVMGMFIIGIICLVAGGYMLFKAYNLYEDNPINQQKVNTLDVANQCSKIAIDNAKQVNEIYKTISEDLGKEQTVITGLQPKVVAD